MENYLLSWSFWLRKQHQCFYFSPNTSLPFCLTRNISAGLSSPWMHCLNLQVSEQHMVGQSVVGAFFSKETVFVVQVICWKLEPLCKRIWAWDEQLCRSTWSEPPPETLCTPCTVMWTQQNLEEITWPDLAPNPIRKDAWESQQIGSKLRFQSRKAGLLI